MRTTDSLKLHSYAKVNLTLEVCGLRADGFHDIDSVVTVINLRDDIEVTPANAGVIDVVVAYGLAPSGPDNIVYRAADAFFDATGIQGGARLALHKHIPMMAGFHKRYMASNKILRLWVKMARKLDIAMIVPQHGASIVGSKAVKDFLDWIENLPCGVDLFDESNYQVATTPLDAVAA